MSEHRSEAPLPPLNEREQTDKEYGSQNMRLFYTVWKDCRNRYVSGLANGETRQRALVELVRLRRRIGAPEIMVNSYISVAPNYFIYPQGKYILYELGFEMFFTLPVGNRDRMYESNYRDKVAGYSRLMKYAETNVSDGFMPKGLIRVPLGRVTLVDLDLKQGLGRIRAGKVRDYNCFDIRFSLDFTVQNRLDAARTFLESIIDDDLSEQDENTNEVKKEEKKEEKVNEW